MPGVTPYSPVATSQGVMPYQGAVPATWAYQENGIAGMIGAIMPIIVLVMLMAMIMPMFRGMTESAK